MDIINQGKSRSYKIGEIKKGTIWAFSSVLLYKLILDLSYYLIVSHGWSYAKFELHPNNIKLVESYCLLFVIFLLMPKSSKKLSDVVVWLLILLSYIPMLVLFALEDDSRIFMYAVTGFWLLVFLLSRFPSVFLPSLKEAGVILFSLFIVFGLIGSFVIYKYLEFSLNFDLSKVYEIRSSYSEVGIPLAGYLFNWLAYIVNPIFFALFTIKRKWIFVVFIVSLQLLLFSNTGNKTYLFALVFVAGLMWIISRKNSLCYMAIGLTCIIFMGMLSYWLINDAWITSLFTVRSLLDQPHQYFFYYDFFSTHDFTFLSQHRLFRAFLEYPYHLDPPNLIGEYYYGNPESNANTGIVGDAYMNFGFPGLALWGILLVIILITIDSFSQAKDKRVVVAAIAMPIICLINTPLLTNFMTDGLLLSLLILYLLPKNHIVDDRTASG